MKKGWKMNFDVVMQIIGVLVLPILGFLYKETSTCKKDLAEFKTEVAKEYAMKEEIKRIEDKIDKQQDTLKDLYNLIIERLPKKNV